MIRKIDGYYHCFTKMIQPEMEETQTINEKCRDFVDSHIAKETEDEARKKLSESLEEEFEVRFLKNSRTKAE